ncbi:MAG: hypothetical protein ABWJ97_04165 [Thermoproteus sp.]
MCDEVAQFVEWLYQNYSGVWGLYRPYVATFKDIVVAGINFERGSSISGGVPVGVVLYGVGDRAEAYCSLPIACRSGGREVRMGSIAVSEAGPYNVELPLVRELDMETICLDGNIAVAKSIGCADIYNHMAQFVVACGLLNKWARTGGDVLEEFKKAFVS